MRYSYLVPRGVVVLLIWTFFAFFFDPMVRQGVVLFGETAWGARIDVCDLQTTFLAPSLIAKDVRVANRFESGTNLFEFDELRVQLAGGPLLKKSYIIERAEISGLQLRTNRQDSGQVHRSIDLPFGKPELFDTLHRAMLDAGDESMARVLHQLRTEFDPDQLETVHVSHDLRRRWIYRFEHFETRIRLFEERTKQLQERAENVDGNGLEKIQTYAEITAEVNNLLTDADSLRREFQSLPAAADDDLRALDQARQRDLQTVRQKLAILQLDPQAMTRFLVGPEIHRRIEQAMAWAAWGKRNLSAAVNPNEPERMRGIDITFPRKQELPQFLIERLELSGLAEIGGASFPFQGVLTGVTTDPMLYGEPTRLQLIGTGNGELQLDAILDYTRPSPAYHVNLAYSLPKTSEFELGDRGSLPLHVTAAHTECLAELKWWDDQLSGRFAIRQQPVTITIDSGKDFDNEARQLLQSVLRGVQTVEAELVVSGHVDAPHWSLDSNLGPQLANGVNRMLTAQIEKKRRQLADEIDMAARDQTVAFEKLLNERYGKLIARLNRNETDARRLIENVAGGNPLDWKKLLRR